eukprot:g2402.t1
MADCCCFCFSDEPVMDGDKKSVAGDHSWKVKMMDTPCESCCPFVGGCLCPCCSAMLLRREALNTKHPGSGLEHYQCFQGMRFCGCCCQPCVTMSSLPCLRCPCWCAESFLCPALSISATRSFLQHEYSIMSDPCDNRLIRFNNCMQCCSCVCDCLACITRIQAVETAAHIFDLISCIVFSCTMGCMVAQANDECEHRQGLAEKKLDASDISGTRAHVVVANAAALLRRRVMYVVLATILLGMAVFGAEMNEGKSKRKRYAKMLAIKRSAIQTATEAFERSQAAAAASTADENDKSSDKSTDEDAKDASSEVPRFHIHENIRARGVAETEHVPSVVEFFKNYELRSKPVRILSDAFRKQRSNDDDAEVSTSDHRRPPSACVIDTRSDACAAWRDESMQVPAYVVNDYAKRCSEGLSFHDRWPEGFVLQASGRPTEVERLTACPYNMHQLLWVQRQRGAKSERENDDDDVVVRAALLDAHQQPFLYGDFSTKFQGDFSKVNVFQPNFQKFPLLRRAAVSVTEVRKGDVLFVPSGWLAEVNAPASGKIILWRHCLVDASNLNLVESSLRVEALVSDEAAELHASIRRLSGRTDDNEEETEDTDDNATTTSNHTINETAPADSTEETSEIECSVGLDMWQCVTSWRRDLTAVHDIGHRGIEASERMAVLRRGKAGRTRFGHWQQLQTWRQLVRKHTVATPSAFATKVGADFSILRWFAGSTGSRDVIMGYHIVWKLVDATHADEHDSALHAKRIASSSLPEPKTAGVLTLSYVDYSASSVRLSDANDLETGISASHCSQGGRCFQGKGADETEEDDDEITVLIRGLSPGHTYQLWVLPSVTESAPGARGGDPGRAKETMTYESIGPTRLEPMLALTLTTFASHVATAPRPPRSLGVSPSAVNLQWSEPLPHTLGGLPVVEYVVERRKLASDDSDRASEVLSHWGNAVHFQNARTSGWVKGLTPGNRYAFRIAIVNSRGVGTFSNASLPTSTQQLSGHAAKRKIEASTTAREEAVTKTSAKASVEEQASTATQKRPPSRLSQASRGRLDTKLPTHLAEDALSHRAALTPCYGPLLSLSDAAQRAVLHVAWNGVGSPADDIRGAHVAITDESEHDASPTQTKTFSVWAAHYSPRSFSVTAEVVRTDPPKATSKIENEAQIRDRIALIARGGAPLRTKVLHAQQAGAVAAVIYDNTGRCDKRFDQRCSPGADRSSNLGFAAQDTPESWSQLKIPAVLLRGADADEILRLVDGKRVL